MTFHGLVETGRVKLSINDPGTEAEFQKQMESFSLRLRRSTQREPEEGEEIPAEDLVLSLVAPIWYAQTKAPSDTQRRSEVVEAPDPRAYWEGSR